MRKPSKDIQVDFVKPERGFDQDRLSMALSMLISEKDIVEYFTNQFAGNSHPGQDKASAIKHHKPPFNTS